MPHAGSWWPVKSTKSMICTSLETSSRQVKIWDIVLLQAVIKWQLVQVFHVYSAPAAIRFVFVVGKNLTRLVHVTNWLNGWPNVPMRVRQLIGYLPTRRNALTATQELRKIKGVIIWIVDNVSMNFVGYAWVNGLIMVKSLVGTTSVIVTIQVRQSKAKLKHKRLKES